MTIEIQDSNRLPQDFCIFYSWQDHLPKKLHRFLIRDALQQAISSIQADLPDDLKCTLRCEEGTDNRAGTIAIADTILQKINSSSVIVGDVTPVLSDNSKGWFYPNPNVMAEIGFAAKAIGWNRIICVYNNSTCGPEQLPFDIRHRRVTGFFCDDKSNRKEVVDKLKGILISAILSVIDEIGRGVIDPSIGDAAVRHQYDLRFLRDVMSTIHRPTLDNFIESGLEYRLLYNCIFFWHGFDAIVRSSHFRFHDKNLMRLARELHQEWGNTMQYCSLAFSPGDTMGTFVLKSYHFGDIHSQDIVDKMVIAFSQLDKALEAFLDHVHDKFLEIDMNETDKMAWDNNLPYISPQQNE